MVEAKSDLQVIHGALVQIAALGIQVPGELRQRLRRVLQKLRLVKTGVEDEGRRERIRSVILPDDIPA